MSTPGFGSAFTDETWFQGTVTLHTVFPPATKTALESGAATIGASRPPTPATAGDATLVPRSTRKTKANLVLT